jgi:hypothetical protein
MLLWALNILNVSLLWVYLLRSHIVRKVLFYISVKSFSGFQMLPHMSFFFVFFFSDLFQKFSLMKRWWITSISSKSLSQIIGDSGVGNTEPSRQFSIRFLGH